MYADYLKYHEIAVYSSLKSLREALEKPEAIAASKAFGEEFAQLTNIVKVEPIEWAVVNDQVDMVAAKFRSLARECHGVVVAAYRCRVLGRALNSYLFALHQLETQLSVDWLVTPMGGGNYRMRRTKTGETWFSTQPVYDIWGADRNSTSARNRYPLMVPGEVIGLEPGEYPKFRLTKTFDVNEGVPYGLKSDNKIRPDQVTFGKDPVSTIRAVIPGSVVIVPDTEIGGTKTLYMEWTGAVRLDGLVFQGDDQAIVATENHHEVNEWQHFRDIALTNCELRGNWDARTNAQVNPAWPLNTKWGLFHYGIGRSAVDGPGFLVQNCKIHGINGEHCGYGHWFDSGSPTAVAALIEDCEMFWSKRTAHQWNPREGEEPIDVESKGTIIHRRVRVRDVCLESGGGGSAFSNSGNFTGELVYEKCDVELGGDPALHASVRDNVTGCLVSYMGDGVNPADQVTVKDCRFVVGAAWQGKGSARRPNISVSNTKQFSLLLETGKCMGQPAEIRSYPGAREALSLDLGTIGKLRLSASYPVFGAVVIAGTKHENYAAALNALAGLPNVEILP